jgi:thioredoxin 1
MRYSTHWKRPVYVAAAFVAVAGVLFAYKATSGGSSWNSNNTMPISTIGDQNMSIAHANASVLHADENNFANVVLKSKVPVLVDFYADWCGPCKRIAPILEELATEVPNAKIVKINVEDSPSLAAEYGINAIPSLKLFENGQVSEEIVGLASKGQLQAMLGR